MSSSLYARTIELRDGEVAIILKTVDPMIPRMAHRVESAQVEGGLREDSESAVPLFVGLALLEVLENDLPAVFAATKRIMSRSQAGRPRLVDP